MSPNSRSFFRRHLWLLVLCFAGRPSSTSALWFSRCSSGNNPTSPTSPTPTAASTPNPTLRPSGIQSTAEPTTPSLTVSPGFPSASPHTAAPTAAPSLAPTPEPTTAATSSSNEPYTIIVMSDVENKWRGHNLDRSRFVVQYIRDVKQQNFYFEGDYSQYKIDPQLVINNGDVSHFWNCHNPNYLYISGSCRTPEDEFVDIWDQLYDANIPLISAYGNHDWRPRIGTGNPVRGTPTKPRDTEADSINRWSSSFVQQTYEKSKELGVGLEFEAIPPTGAIGQSMYRGTFRGLQVASFNAAYNWQSYDDNGIYDADEQFARLSDTLNRTQHTLFFSHFPLSSTRLEGQTPTSAQAQSLIQEFPSGSHHFSGHYHAAMVQEYDGFNDYVAPYPHSWGSEEPGYLAVLVSPQDGILQVKPMTIPGLERGAPCIPVNAMDLRNPLTPAASFLRPSQTKHDRGLENGCDRCKAGQQHWSDASSGWVCGEVGEHQLGRQIYGLGGEVFDSLEDEIFDD